MQHILFPVDFSDRCSAARPMVASWVQKFQAKLTLFHTIQIPLTAYGSPDGDPVMVDLKMIEESGKNRLERFEMADAKRVVTIGDPAFEIVDYAGANGVDLIMMPTHGYGKFRSLLLGSVAAKVLHDAHCPVWTDAHTEKPSVRADIHSILCAIEAGGESAALLESAKVLAAEFGAELKLLHVSEGGNASHEVRVAALEFNADLVITGRAKIQQPFGRLRSHEYSIIRDSPCPVLSI